MGLELSKITFYFRLEKELKRYYADPQRFQDVQTVLTEFDKVMDDPDYCSSDLKMNQMTEFLLTEGVISTPYRPNVWYR